jgi:hypothetical protein
MLPAYITFNVCNNSAQIALYSERALGRLGSGLAESRLARAALRWCVPLPIAPEGVAQWIERRSNPEDGGSIPFAFSSRD